MDDRSEELTDFLKQARSQGESLGTGSFSLHALKAAQKLAHYQLEQPGLWLVKLVQAAVAAKALDVRISLRRSGVEVRLAQPKSWQALEILDYVISGERPEVDCLFHLCTGIRASVAVPGESVSWVCGGRKVKLSTSETSVEPHPPSKDFVLTAQRVSRSRSLSAKLRTPLVQLLKQTADEFAEVDKGCRLCPIPVKLDGRWLQRGYGFHPVIRVNDLPLMQSDKSVLQIPICLAQLPVELDGFERLPYPLESFEGELAVRRVSPGKGAGLRFAAQENSTGAVLSLWLADRFKDNIDFVVDGVVVETREMTPVWVLEKPFLVLRLTLGARANETDLSHFKVARSVDPYLFKTFRPQLEEVLRQISSRSELFSAPHPMMTNIMRRTMFGVQGALFTCLSYGVGLIPFVLWMGGMPKALTTRQVRGQLRKRLQEFAERLAEEQLQSD